jgi:hypothetical protein
MRPTLDRPATTWMVRRPLHGAASRWPVDRHGHRSSHSRPAMNRRLSGPRAHHTWAVLADSNTSCLISGRAVSLHITEQAARHWRDQAQNSLATSKSSTHSSRSVAFWPERRVVAGRLVPARCHLDGHELGVVASYAVALPANSIVSTLVCRICAPRAPLPASARCARVTAGWTWPPERCSAARLPGTPKWTPTTVRCSHTASPPCPTSGTSPQPTGAPSRPL